MHRVAVGRALSARRDRARRLAWTSDASRGSRSGARGHWSAGRGGRRPHGCTWRLSGARDYLLSRAWRDSEVDPVAARL